LATPAGKSTLKDAAWLGKLAWPVPVTVTADARPLSDALKEKLVVVTAAGASRRADLAVLDEAPAPLVSPKVAPTPITPTVATTVSHFVLGRDISDLLQI
jgi:hypothetical protein